MTARANGKTNGKKPRRASKTPTKRPTLKPSGLVAQHHANGSPRGAIYQGAPANPVAGTGRPPSQVRLRALGSFDRRIGVVEEIADGIAIVDVREKCAECGHEPGAKMTSWDILKLAPTAADRLRAVDVLGKYGLGEQSEITIVSPDVRIRLRQQVEIITSRQSWNAKELLAALDPVWQ